jgi:hypothetical protein
VVAVELHQVMFMAHKAVKGPEGGRGGGREQNPLEEEQPLALAPAHARARHLMVEEMWASARRLYLNAGM